ncbi:hypothetical protein GLOIN_2v1773502 [Rhizophagus irregularis DAOM 181602=DAOM 197198]|nr:hypothetical protein RhiirB3_393527 [Rhizophagus irregularis]GBC33489.2 hypothetical protein GLOIN_2v1773502 [Rhizophagus irregularis DAOM 181602=DAOM 197198]
MNRNHFRDLPELIRPEMQKYGSEKTVPSKLARMSYVFNIAYFFVTDNGTQTDNITCNHEEEINKRRYFWSIHAREHEDRIKANKQLRNETKNMKMQVPEAEKILASMKAT